MGLGFFYGGFGAIITPGFGVTDLYAEDTTQYYNALGIFVMSLLIHYHELTDPGSVDRIQHLPHRVSSYVSLPYAADFC